MQSSHIAEYSTAPEQCQARGRSSGRLCDVRCVYLPIHCVQHSRGPTARWPHAALVAAAEPATCSIAAKHGRDDVRGRRAARMLVEHADDQCLESVLRLTRPWTAAPCLTPRNPLSDCAGEGERRTLPFSCEVGEGKGRGWDEARMLALAMVQTEQPGSPTIVRGRSTASRWSGQAGRGPRLVRVAASLRLAAGRGSLCRGETSVASRLR